MFTNSYKPYTSGVVRSLETFKQHLENMGHTVYIFAPGYGTSDKDTRVFRYHSIPAPTARGYYLPIPLSWRTTRRVKKLGLDIIHVHAPTLLGQLGLMTGRRLGIPVVFTYHTRYDLYTHYVPIIGHSLRRLVERMATRFSNRCQSVIAPTPSIRSILTANGVTTPIHVVPTGVDPQEFQSFNKTWAQEEFGLTDDDNVLVTVGRLGKEKNIGFLLKVMTQLPSDVRLLIVGDGPLRANLRGEVTRLGLGERVTFTGQLGRERLASTMWASKIFLFSSTTDTQGVVLLEAHLADLPVVALDAPGAQDIITHGENGFLVEGMSVNGFADYTQSLLTDAPMRERMLAAGRRRVEDYTAEACAQRLVEVYQATCAMGTE